MPVTRFREAASVYVDVPADELPHLLADADLLRALDDRLADRNLEIQQAGDRVEVRDLEGHVHVAFRFETEGSGTRLAAAEDIRPEGFLETTKLALFPGQAHEHLEQQLKRLQVLLEAMHAGQR